MTADSRRSESYEQMLRTVGAYLDQEPAARFRLIEVPGGFTLILEERRSSPDLRELHFSRASLADQADQLARGRRLFGSRSNPTWRLAPGGYQDFLRALGYELDHSHASAILLDELEDGMLLTYSYLDPQHGYQWRKHITTLPVEEMAALLKEAHGRRQRRGLLRR